MDNVDWKTTISDVASQLASECERLTVSLARGNPHDAAQAVKALASSRAAPLKLSTAIVATRGRGMRVEVAKAARRAQALSRAEALLPGRIEALPSHSLVGGQAACQAEQPRQLLVQEYATGALVEYSSASAGQWIPAVVRGFDEAAGTYTLDVHDAANPEKVRVRRAVSPHRPQPAALDTMMAPRTLQFVQSLERPPPTHEATHSEASRPPPTLLPEAWQANDVDAARPLPTLLPEAMIAKDSEAAAGRHLTPQPEEEGLLWPVPPPTLLPQSIDALRRATQISEAESVPPLHPLIQAPTRWWSLPRVDGQPEVAQRVMPFCPIGAAPHARPAWPADELQARGPGAGVSVVAQASAEASDKGCDPCAFVANTFARLAAPAAANPRRTQLQKEDVRPTSENMQQEEKGRHAHLGRDGRFQSSSRVGNMHNHRLMHDGPRVAIQWNDGPKTPSGALLDGWNLLGPLDWRGWVGLGSAEDSK